MKYKELEDAEQKGFNYYNPIDARYEINDIQPDNLNTLKKAPSGAFFISPYST
mgnify:CR=1 FL=1